MSTLIEWTDETWNPVTGCDRISPGCKHCYAKTLHDRRHKAFLSGKKMPPQYAEPFEHVQCWPDRLDIPLHWRAPRLCFVNSGADLFHEDVPFEFLGKLYSRMEMAERHTFQTLTKRPERMLESYAKAAQRPWIRGWPLLNVWPGVSIESRKYLGRLDDLRQVPAPVRMVSFEPLLEDLGRVNLEGIGWAIVGGESGPGARPMHPDWARSLRDQCIAANVPFFFKQWGEWSSDVSYRVGKKNAGRQLDGREWNEFPKPYPGHEVVRRLRASFHPGASV